MATEPARIDAKKFFGLALIPAFLLLIIVLVALNLPHTYEPPFLLGFLNTLFLGVIPIIIAYVAMKAFTRNGSVSIFLIGSGLLIFGLGSIVAGWVNPLPGGPNMTVTIHNSCALLSSLFILLGAVLSNSTRRSETRTGHTGIIVATYTGIFIFVGVFSFATMQGLIPPFFIPGSGPTVLRQIVLENAVAFFAISSVLFLLAYRKRRSDFLFWFTVALGLVTIGLLAVFLQPSVGSLIGWVGRAAQYLGCIFALIAVLFARKIATEKGLPLEDIIANFYIDPDVKLEAALASMTDAVSISDTEGGFIDFNDAFATFHRFRNKEECPRTLAEYPDIIEVFMADGKPAQPDMWAVPRALRGEKGTNVEYSLRRKDSGEAWVGSYSFGPIRNKDGEIIGSVVSGRDITEYKKTEEALQKAHDELEDRVKERTAQLTNVNKDLLREIAERKLAEETLVESEEKYRALFSAESDGIFVVDKKTGIIIDCNDAITPMYGYRKDEVIGQPNTTISAEPDATRAATLEVKGLIPIRYHKRKDCSIFPVEITASVVPVKGHDVIVAAVRDISERKRVEEALALTSRKLNLLSSITRHDINNQLTILMGYLKILENKQPDTTQNEYFSRVSTAAKRIAAMIKFTGEYEKIGINTPVWQDIRTLVDTAVRQAPLGQVFVKNDFPSGAEVFADPLIVKVFYNLMDNAVRYGGKITTIRFSVQESGNDRLIICEDDGDGIAAEEKEQIFERGYGKNTGLGLALSREILSITGITITETGEAGKGARFEITVPKGMWRIAGNDA